MSCVFRAPYFKNSIEEDNINDATKKLKEILELDENENGWSDISSDEDDDDEPNQEKEEYVVEKVLAEKVEKGKLKFLVKWLGYDDEDDQTWEPLENFFTKGSKMAIFLFYQKKWKKQMKEQKKNGGDAKTSSPDAVKISAGDGKRTFSIDDDENDPPTTSKSKFSKNASAEKRHSSFTNVPAKKFKPFQPSKRIKIFESSYPEFAINKNELQRKREIEQKQAKEIIEKKLEEKRRAEKRKREEAEREKKLALERAKELEAEENRRKLRKDLWSSSDEEDYEDAAEE
uniref:Chromo domain-containing protein n=1 Tax=Panagrolaimus sp. PS1159 TaxID=55785 RepID=A0AC35EZP1_9BILA